MKLPRPLIALVPSLFAASAAITSAFATGAILSRSAARNSHQQPTTEQFFETRAATTPALIARGRVLYLGSCAHCHGADARGDEGPDLHGVQVSDRYITQIIRHGIPHEMPAFEKKHDANNIAALLAYVRSLE
jgi:mono/diheme cytochrome c family protein